MAFYADSSILFNGVKGNLVQRNVVIIKSRKETEIKIREEDGEKVEVEIKESFVDDQSR